MAEIYRLDKIVVLREGEAVSALVHEIGETGLTVRLTGGGYDLLSYNDEGTVWARGWEGPAVNALYTVNAINNPPEPDDNDYWEGNT